MKALAWCCQIGLLAILMTAAPVRAETVRLTNGEWAPYLSETLPHHGAASHIVSKAFEKVGVTVKYGFFPWKRSYRLAEQGRWHGTVVWVFTEKRAKDFLYSDVVIEDAEYLFHLKEAPLEWRTPADLGGVATSSKRYPHVATPGRATRRK